MEEYKYPEIFLRDEKSNKYICRVSDEYVLVKEPVSNECYGHIIYEDILKYFDLANPILEKDVIVVPEFSDEELLKGLFVKKGTKLCLIEISGYEPYVSPREGGKINVKDKIGMVITNKYEVRVIKSPCEGVVIFVINIVWEKPEKYILAVVSENDVRQITIRKSQGNRV